MRARVLISVAVLATMPAGCQPAATPVAAARPNPASSVPHELTSKARLARAQQRLQLSGYREAEADFRGLLGTPEVTQARLGLAEVLVITGRADAALEELMPLSDPSSAAPAALLRARALQS